MLDKMVRFLFQHISIVFLFLLIFANQGIVFGQLFSSANPTKKAKVLPKAYIGVKFGSNFSYLSGSTWNNGIKSNLVGGAYAGIKGLGLGVQAEGLFEQSEYVTGDGFFQAYKAQFNSLGDSLKQGTFRVNKLSLPLLLQFKVAKLFWLQAGVQFYGIVSVKDFNNLVKDSKALFKSGGTAGILGTTVHLGNADIGARAIFDFKNINKQQSADIWKQYLLQLHVGIKLF